MCHGHGCSAAGTSIHRGWAAASATTAINNSDKQPQQQSYQAHALRTTQNAFTEKQQQQRCTKYRFNSSKKLFHNMQFSFLSEWKVFLNNYVHLISANNNKNKESEKIVTQKSHSPTTTPRHLHHKHTHITVITSKSKSVFEKNSWNNLYAKCAKLN